MRNQLKLIAAGLTVVMAAFAAMPAVAVAARQGGGGGGADLTLPVTGTFTDALGGVGTFTGEFTLDGFVAQGWAARRHRDSDRHADRLGGERRRHRFAGRDTASDTGKRHLPDLPPRARPPRP